VRSFRTIDPSRAEIDHLTVGTPDIIDALKVFNAALARFEETQESRHATIACQEIDKLEWVIGLMKKGVRAEQHRINQRWAKGVEGRMREIEAGKRASF